MNSRLVLFSITFFVFAAVISAMIYFVNISEPTTTLGLVNSGNTTEDTYKAELEQSTGSLSAMVKTAFKYAFDIITFASFPWQIRIPLLFIVVAISLLVARELASGILGVLWGR